jgi:hypothetical protein
MRSLFFKRTTWLFLAILWLVWALFKTRYAMLDDALIHLRYAAFLRTTHHITFNGVHPDYGTSSLLYVGLLAFLRGLTASPLLPKAVSVCAYLALLGSLWSLGSSLRESLWAKRLWCGLLIALLTPMAIRWLTDGMETSLTLLLITWVAVLCKRLPRLKDMPVWGWIALPVLGALLVLMRIELVMLAFLVSILLGGPELLSSSAEGRQARRRTIALLLGTGLIVLAIRIVFGHLLPDTALAKSGRPSIIPVFGIAHVTASSFLLGIGTTVVSIASAVIVLLKMIRARVSKERLFLWAVANASYWIVLILACMRGQSIQGVRYILWPLLFSTIWNILTLEELGPDAPAPASIPRSTTALSWAYVLLVLLIAPLDAWYGFHAMMGRAKTFLQMRDSGLASLHDDIIVAGDVGFIGYFSQGNVCDVDGLVNGREIAALTPPMRSRRCAESRPKALFLTIEQQRTLGHYLNLEDWSPCMIVDFQNVKGNDRHYLLLPKVDMPGACTGVRQ